MPNAPRTDTALAADHVAQVRRLLRHREYEPAVELIDRRLSAIAEVAAGVPVEDVRTYAYERLAQHGPGPSRRPPVNLRRGRPVSLRRPVQVDLRRLDRPTLERVLRWVLAAELRAAEAALRAGDYPTTVAAAEAAARIDDRSTRIAYVHARALYEVIFAELNRSSPDYEAALGNVQRAARLVARAAADPDLRDPQKRLSSAIGELATVVERGRTRTARAEAVTAVVARFERLVRHYSTRDQLASHIQIGNARASLAQIRAEVERLSRQHGADTPTGRLLADLHDKCGRYKEHLERIGRSVGVVE